MTRIEIAHERVANVVHRSISVQFELEDATEVCNQGGSDTFDMIKKSTRSNLTGTIWYNPPTEKFVITGKIEIVMAENNCKHLNEAKGA